MKRILALTLSIVLCLGLFIGCGKTEKIEDPINPTNDAKTLNIGAILVGDETEGYTLAHMNGIEAAIAELAEEGINIEINYQKKVPEDASVATKANQLIAGGCQLIITNSYGHQFNFDNVIESNPEVKFVAMTGDLAKVSGLENYANAFTDIYEARYVSGVIAGLKLNELLQKEILTPEKLPDAYDENGNIKIGYIGAFNYAEVVSGYTAFYLGVKSVCPNVVMIVKYTNSWFSEEREAAVAEFLRTQGCVIIGQHADSTGAPAAIQKSFEANPEQVCYSVGYNVSMVDVAPDAILTSASNNWAAYYTELFRAIANGENAPADWSEGYAKNAVCTTELGKNCAEGTQEYIDKIIEDIVSGNLHIFNCDTFTVNGDKIIAYVVEGLGDCIVTDGEVKYFEESSLRSAPYFDIRIDGIVELAADAE